MSAKHINGEFTQTVALVDGQGALVAVPGPTSNISGTTTAANAAQNAAAANPNRKGFWIQNLSLIADLWVNTLVAATVGQPSLRLVPGAIYESPPGGAGTGAISVISASPNQPFSGREW